MSSKKSVQVPPVSGLNPLGPSPSPTPTNSSSAAGVFSLTATKVHKQTLSVGMPTKLPPLRSVRLPTPSTCRTDVASNANHHSNQRTALTLTEEIQIKGYTSGSVQRQNHLLNPVLKCMDLPKKKNWGGLRSAMKLRGKMAKSSGGSKNDGGESDPDELEDDHHHHHDDEAEARRKKRKKETSRAMKDALWKIAAVRECAGMIITSTMGTASAPGKPGNPTLEEMCYTMYTEIQENGGLSSPAANAGVGAKKAGGKPVGLGGKGSTMMIDSDSDLDSSVDQTQDSSPMGSFRCTDGEFVPTFKDGTHNKKRQLEPRTYVAKTIFNLRSNPFKWRAFSEKMDEIHKERDAEERRLTEARMCNPMRDNISSVMTNSPERKSEARLGKLIQHKLHAKEVAHRHDDILANHLEGIMTTEKKREIRHEELALAWISLCMFAARSNFLMDAVRRRRWEEWHLKATAAAVMVQRNFRWKYRGKRSMPHVLALLLRARFLRRILTRIRVRLRHIYTVRVLDTLKKIDFNCRALAAFRSFGTRVRTIQRWWKQRYVVFGLQRRLRMRQWKREVALRDYTLTTTLSNAKLDAQEKGLATTKMIESTAAELNALQNIPPDMEESLILEYLGFYEQDYRKKQEKWEKAVNDWLHTGNRWRSAKPVKPYRRVLLPHEVLQVTVRNAARDHMETLEKAEIERRLGATPTSPTPSDHSQEQRTS